MESIKGQVRLTSEMVPWRAADPANERLGRGFTRPSSNDRLSEYVALTYSPTLYPELRSFSGYWMRRAFPALGVFVPLIGALVGCPLRPDPSTASLPVFVTSVSPPEARIGTEIGVSGGGFGESQGSSTLTINGTAVTAITSWTATEIRAVIPHGASTGPVVVSTGGTKSNGGRLAVLWDNANPLNQAVSTAASNQDSCQVASDGVGGSVVVWEDSRGGLPSVYAQRLNGAGEPQWTMDGVPICTAASDSTANCQIVSDGQGGAIVSWEDSRSGTSDIYAQRVGASGNVQWPADGVAVCSATDAQYSPRMIPDGAGGAFITWYDYRSGTSYDIYAQRLNGAGGSQWTANGVPVSAAAGNQAFPQITSDGAGGAVISWEDTRNTNLDIYAQRLDGSGSPAWTVDGVAVCVATGDQRTLHLVGDGSGGAIIAWQDSRGGGTFVYSQRVDASGTPQWAADGVAASTVGTNEQLDQVVTDGSGGAILGWQDNRFGTTSVLAQRVSHSGAMLWGVNGLLVKNSSGSPREGQLVSDGTGGAEFVWWEGAGYGAVVLAQRINASGGFEWSSNGVAVSTGAGDRSGCQLASLGQGGIVIAWVDSRNGSSNTDVFAQGIQADGAE
ncbi:MAG TPA: IPT/TIG domain-containing protein [Spirochaetia bacterium]|nr:IPT/TIG domain-containing protein [Spirochaetia bacterium]